MTDIEILPAKTWKTIMAAALKIVEEKKRASKPASTVKAPQCLKLWMQMKVNRVFLAG